MKTALCLSGHLRTFAHTANALRANVIEPLNCDIFIHTWDVIGAPTGKNPGDIDNQNNKTISYINQINELLCPAAISIEDERTKLNHLIQQTNDIVVPAEQRQFIMKHVGLHVGMFYSIYEANNLRKQYETSNDIQYDLVIRCRPDLFFKDRLDFSMFPDNQSIYVPEIATYASDGINDQVAIGSSEVMNKYCDIYHNVADYYRNNVCTARPEVMIKYHLDLNNVTVETRNINYDLYRLDGSILKQFKMHAEWAPGSFK
jgi:hypothetical protein